MLSALQNLMAAVRHPAIDPVLFHVGPAAIRWYGLAYVAAFLLGYCAMRRMTRSWLHITAAQLGDLVSWCAVGVLLGGRIGWWLFYHRAAGAVEPWYEPIALWHGGMSFHGGTIGVGMAITLWCWRNRAPFWNVADAVALIAPIGLFLGRIANFVNAELVGRPTNLPWGVIFPGETIPRHPSEIYEAVLEGPVLAALLWLVWRKLRLRDGQISALFLILYGLLRFGVEFTRQPDAQLGFIAFGWLTMGQLLSLMFAVAGMLVWFSPMLGSRHNASRGPAALT
ncbi:MAG TPA: prolipoprotein diacylglyceryl transferase [Tepidisphaeraceae bacterium]|nr:prolipoprotein diacylglyceryl transferase [Tepidisphaeraceae bacterium]